MNKQRLFLFLIFGCNCRAPLEQALCGTHPDSLKESTGEKRGKGVCRKVSGETKLPGRWIDFLYDSKSKRKLFTFLTHKLIKLKFPPGKLVYATAGQSVLFCLAYISIRYEGY